MKLTASLNVDTSIGNVPAIKDCGNSADTGIAALVGVDRRLFPPFSESQTERPKTSYDTPAAGAMVIVLVFLEIDFFRMELHSADPRVIGC
ncbi:unnamed protein product, partial [marine sediment metagenome]